MSRKISLTLVAAVLVATTTLVATAQNASANSDRKVATRVAPVYPELAKRMHIHGVVRVEAIVRPNGAVKSTRILGGNPVLVDAAQQAITKWKFEPAQSETTEIVQLTFDGD
ncbi:MAG TPA: energy transducer TonB [Candidatus Sulfotelmatobacter sp.]|nr:energy transducer TonB [Candidatus Sulfotelmatobacter sp.]